MYEEYKTMNIPNGYFLGYPKCCVEEFGDIATPIVFKPKVCKEQSFNGYIPCHSCANKLASGELTREAVIKDINSRRVCTIPFSEQISIADNEELHTQLMQLMTNE